MTDPRIKAGARALCVLGGGHTTEGTYPNCDHVAQHEEGARVALAAADAVDPVRKAAWAICVAPLRRVSDTGTNALLTTVPLSCIAALREALATQEASDD